MLLQKEACRPLLNLLWAHSHSTQMVSSSSPKTAHLSPVRKGLGDYGPLKPQFYASEFQEGQRSVYYGATTMEASQTKLTVLRMELCLFCFHLGILLLFWEGVSLCSPGWPWTHSPPEAPECLSHRYVMWYHWSVFSSSPWLLCSFSLQCL